MAQNGKPEVGSIGWIDLTVDDAPGIRGFYEHVAGYVASPVDMGDYADFTLDTPDSRTPTAGVCHARGSNAGLPAQWLIYITVADVEASAERCRESGGTVLVGPKKMGSHGSYCVIRDPAGAVSALFEPA